MKYTPQTPIPRYWSWEDTAVLRDTDMAVTEAILNAAEGDSRQWIHANPKAASELLLSAINQYHRAIQKFLSNLD